MQSNKEAVEKGWVKSSWFWLAVAIAIVTNGLQLMFGYVDTQAFKKEIDGKVTRHEERIGRLESVELSNHDLLMEMRFNLKVHIESTGGKYVMNSPGMYNGSK